MYEKTQSPSCQTEQCRRFFPQYLWQSMALNSTHDLYWSTCNSTNHVFSCLSEPVEQFELLHRAQLVWWQDSLEWNRRDAEQEPEQFLVKRNVNQMYVAQRHGRNETMMIHTAASPWRGSLLNALLLCSLLILRQRTGRTFNDNMFKQWQLLIKLLLFSTGSNGSN